MMGIFEYIASNPKEALTAGNQAVSLIQKLKKVGKKDPSINAMLIEIEKGCFETSQDFRNHIIEFKDYCKTSDLDTSKSMKQLIEDTSILRPDRKLALKYKNAKLTGLKQQFGQFVEDATAILLCYENNSEAKESSDNELYSEAVAKRNDFEAAISLDQPLHKLLENLEVFSNELHSRFNQG